MQKIKILHIIKSLGRGGAEILLPESLHLHDKSRYDFHYIYFLPWKDQMVRPIRDAGGKVTCFKAKNNLQILFKYKKIISYCRKHQIDLIHCHLPWSGFLGRIVFSRTKTAIPVIYTEHNIQERYHPATKWLNKVSFNAQSLALAVSEDVNRSIQEKIGPRISVKTVLNGVNTDHFKRDENKRNEVRSRYGIPKDALVVGNVAVFRKQKNLKVWLQAFKRVSDVYPDVYGLLVGAGPEEDEIKVKIKELDLEEKVLLTGLQVETTTFFSAMDIFMMSSNFEGLPIALLEAMSMKCAVVSTKAGGVVEVVKNGRDGLLGETEDFLMLSENCKKLIGDKGERLRYQKAARKRVEDYFSLSVMVDKLEKIYDSQVKNAPDATAEDFKLSKRCK